MVEAFIQYFCIFIVTFNHQFSRLGIGLGIFVLKLAVLFYCCVYKKRNEKGITVADLRKQSQMGSKGWNTLGEEPQTFYKV